MNAKQTTIKMQSFSQLKLGFGLIAACLMTSPAKAQNNYWQEFGNQPVFIEQNNNGRIQLLKFIDYRDEMIVAEMEMRSRDGTTTVAEIAQPVTEGMVKNLDFKTGAMEAANRSPACVGMAFSRVHAQKIPLIAMPMQSCALKPLFHIVPTKMGPK